MVDRFTVQVFQAVYVHIYYMFFINLFCRLQDSETDTESEESEEESDEEIPHNSTAEDKRKILLERTKRHENRLSSLKKGNNLMKANIERLQDDVNKQREMSLTLQEDLNNILADLG